MSFTGLEIAATVLTGLPAISLSVVWIFSLVHNRQYKDPARRGAGWIKGAIPIFIIALVVLTVGRIYNIVSDYAFPNPRSSYPAYVGLLLEQLAALMVFIAFVETGLGFLHVHSPSSVAVRPRSHVAARIGTYGTALVLLALAAASFGLRVRGFYDYYDWYTSSYSYSYSSRYDDDGGGDGGDGDLYAQATRLFRNASRLNTAFDIICWVLTMPLLGLAGYVVSRCRGSVVAPTLHIYIAAACIWFARFLWHFIYQCGYILPKHSNMNDDAIAIVDPLMSLWFFAVVLVLLVVIFAKKQTGLWSIDQPWMAYQAQPQHAPAAKSVYG